MLFTKQSPDVIPDWDEIASKWLEIIRPIWFEKLQSPRTRPLLLSDVRPDVIKNSKEIIPLVLKLFADIHLQNLDQIPNLLYQSICHCDII